MQYKLLSLAALAASASAQQMMNLTAALGNTPELSNLTTSLGLYPDLVSQLSQLSNITLLAPSNEAFAKLLNSSAGEAFQANNTKLITALFSYHILNGTYYASNVTNQSAFIPTALRNPQYTNVTGGQVVEAVMSNNNVVFYSGALMNSTVTGADHNFTGGVIHIIDTFLTIPLNISSTAVAANLTAAAGALTKADLVDALDTLKDVTCFVPNNEAFQSIGSALENASMVDLVRILQYHVINGTVGYSSDLSNTSLTTLGGSNVTITVEDGNVFVNSAKVLIPDVLVANGVVHVIDNVLNPDNATATPNGAASTQAPAFSGASSASNVPFTGGVSTPTSTVPTETTPGATSSSSAFAMPMKTGAIGAAALFGGAASILNL